MDEKRTSTNGLPPEHPRPTSTDDVECFFSIMRYTIVADFTTKKVMLEWRKVCQEFPKRINPDLPLIITLPHTTVFMKETEIVLTSSNHQNLTPGVNTQEQAAWQAGSR